MNTSTTLSKGSWIRLNQRHAARAVILLLLLLTLPAAMQAQFNYTINNGTVTITGYTGPGGEVTIPSTINGLPVTGIGYEAFYGCGSLTSVTIPGSVASIGNGAFVSCSSLAAITVDALNSAYSSVDGVLFNKSQTTLIQCPGGIAGSYTIPNNVNSIGAAAFSYCTKLTSVGIPDSVTSVGSVAFGYCTGLTSVTIPDTVTSIGESAFLNCLSMTSVTIGSGVTSIGDSAFVACYGLTVMTVDGLNRTYSSVDGVLFNKSQTTLMLYPARKDGSYTIPESVTSIEDYAFNYCQSLFSVTIPNSVTNIGHGAFQSCAALASVTIGNGVTSITDDVFAACRSLTSITIPNRVTSIGGYAFGWCRSLTSITIPNSVTNVGDLAFGDCVSLINITIPNSVNSIGDEAFYDCPSLIGVHFNGNAPNLGGSSVFTGDTNATVYYLPGTTGWGTTFGGRPTALWIQVPAIQTPPQTQTAEAGSAVGLWVHASSPLPLFYLWYLNATNLLSCTTNCQLELPSLQLSQSGAYTVVISNVLGAVTSAPALLNVIAAVERRPVPGVKVTGQTASLWNVDYADSLSLAPNWTPLGSVSLTGTSQYCFDVTLPLPPQRFYRAWQTGTPGVRPSLDLHLVPAVTLTGSIGHSVRLDYINQFGPIDAWVTLATVPLTNTSQLYFDVSAPGQPQRLYRVAQMP